MEKRFGSFNGVFLPTFLTILGVIYFLRLGWVVGSVGIVSALIIIVIAHIITVSTAFSMSSITTNMEVKGGGAYYLISRSLGLEIGGSIGITLYFSQVMSVALYILGFVESVKIIIERNPVLKVYATDRNILILAIIVSIIIGIISIVGADLAIKAQYIIFVIIILGIISIFLPLNFQNVEVMGELKETKSFWVTFSIFFPAVTGILAGVSMSGDLRNPRKNIPIGTFLAIGVTFLIYIFQMLWFEMKISKTELLSDTLILITKSKFSLFIILAIWAATLSSAIGSLVGAPRTMQALALDGVLPKFLGKGTGEANEPRVATIISFLIAFVFIVMGKLDFVAPIITMFFLNAYGAVNLVAGLETFVGNPSYRPIFKTPWYVSFIGAIGSYGVMFLINKYATMISLTVTFLIYLWLSEKKISRTWGDLRSGIWITIARFALLKIRFKDKNESKNWKPDILVFSGNIHQRKNLIYLAKILSKGNGVITLLTYIFGDIKNKIREKKIVECNINRYLKRRKILAFSEVIVADNFKEAAKYTVQSNGIGILKPNTILIGFSKNIERRKDYVEFILENIHLRKNILILKYNDVLKYGNKNKIDIWWGGFQTNGKLMLLLAHLISINDDWRNVNIRLLSIVDDIQKSEEVKNKLGAILDEVRIKAKVKILENEGGIHKLIKENSKDSDLVMLGLATPEKGKEEENLQRIEYLTKGLPTTILVKGLNVEEI